MEACGTAWRWEWTHPLTDAGQLLVLPTAGLWCQPGLLLGPQPLRGARQSQGEPWHLLQAPRLRAAAPAATSYVLDGAHRGLRRQVVTTAPHTGAPRAPAPTQRLQPGLQDLVMLTAPQGPARLNIQATVTLSGHNVNATLPARASCCSTRFPFLVHFPHLQSLPPHILPIVLLHFPSLEQTLPESRLYHFCSLLLPWQPELAAVQKTG